MGKRKITAEDIKPVLASLSKSTEFASMSVDLLRVAIENMDDQAKKVKELLNEEPEHGKFYTYKDKTYVIVRWEARMKHPETREWVRAVVYRDINDSYAFYIREYKDFTSKFEESW